MPLMKFNCSDCQEEFLRFTRLGKRHLNGQCPACKSSNVTTEKSVSAPPSPKAGGPASCDISGRGR